MQILVKNASPIEVEALVGEVPQHREVELGRRNDQAFYANRCIGIRARKNFQSGVVGVNLLLKSNIATTPILFKEKTESSNGSSRVVVVACFEQFKRSAIAIVWRYFIRGAKYDARKTEEILGIKTREPRLFYEIYLKSFCTLWNANIIKENNMSFAMVEHIPGYEMQDQLPKLGYQFLTIPPREMPKYLGNIEAGTVSMVSAFVSNHERVKNYQAILKKVKSG